MAYEDLKGRCYAINMEIVAAGLVKLTWGNASAVDRSGGGAGVMAIKPSGVPYPKLKAEDIVVLDIGSGEVVEGKFRPSSDTPTHLHLYRAYAGLGGIVHTHSDYATSFAQAGVDIPPLGTTHADHFYGTVPCTRSMTQAEVEGEYELNTGRVIVECFKERGVDAEQVPGVLVKSHAPFAWGNTAEKALENAIVLEYVAKMQLQAMTLRANVEVIGQHLLDKHFLRKHGAGAYYGQK